MTEIVFHDNGVLMRDGLVATGNNCCCCECSFPLPEGAPEMTISGSFTLPDDNALGACAAGTFDFSEPAIWLSTSGFYYICHEVVLDAVGRRASVFVQVWCSGGTIYSTAFLFAGECQEIGAPAVINDCLFCNGATVGVGPPFSTEKTHGRVESGGFCMPQRNQQMEYIMDCQPYNAFDGYSIQYEIEW